MRTSLFLLSGFFFLAASLIIAKLFSAHLPSAPTVATVSFIALWLAITALNMWLGVAKAGYSIAEERPLRAREDGRAEGRIREPGEEQGARAERDPRSARPGVQGGETRAHRRARRGGRAGRGRAHLSDEHRRRAAPALPFRDPQDAGRR